MRRVILGILIIVLLSSCSAFGASDTLPTLVPMSDTNSLNDDGIVTISFGVTDYERPRYEPLVDSFHRENPNIHVSLVSLDALLNDYSSDLGLLRSIASTADTFSANAFYLSPKGYASDLLLDLTPLMEADASFNRADFYPGVLELGRMNNRLTVLPRYVFIQALTYNKDLLAQANLPDPQNDWTWDDLLAYASQIGQRRNTASSYGLYDDDDGLITLSILLSQHNLNLLSMDPQTIRLDAPEIAEALAQIRTLQSNGTIYTATKADANDPDTDVYQLVGEGRIAFWNDAYVGAIDGGTDTELSFEKATIPYPAANGIVDDIAGIEGLMISSGTKNPNAAWKWIEFLSRQVTDQDREWLMPNRIPSRESLAQQTKHWESIDAQTASTYKWILENRVRPSSSPQELNYEAYYGMMQTIQQAIQDPKASIAQLLRDAQDNFEQATARVLLTPTVAVDTGPVVVATPVPDTAPAGATTITFLVADYNLADMRSLARSFQQENPQIYIELRSAFSSDDFQGFEQLSKGADCFNWYSSPSSPSDYRHLLNLSPLIDADASFPISDFPKATLQSFQSQGGIYGLPQQITLRTFNYNRPAFEAAGIAEPTVAWTHNDFLAAAQALSTGTGQQKIYGYLPINDTLFELIFFANTFFDTRLTSGSGEQLRANFADPKAIEAIQWYLNLSKLHQVSPPLVLNYSNAGSKEDPTWDYAREGRGAMWLGYGPTFNYLDGSLGFPFEEAISVLPLGQNGFNSNVLSSVGLYISAQSQHSQSCWQWLKYITNATSPSILQGGIPARSSISESSSYTAQAEPIMRNLYDIHRDVLKREPSKADNEQEINQLIDSYWLFQALDKYFNQNTDLNQALTEAQTTTNAYLDCLFQNGQPYKRASCAKQVDPSYDGFNSEDEQSAQ